MAYFATSDLLAHYAATREDSFAKKTIVPRSRVNSVGELELAPQETFLLKYSVELPYNARREFR
jgi:hypothetical protein